MLILGMRKTLKTQMNELNTKYQATKLEMQKANCSRQELEQLANFRRAQEERLKKLYSDDLMKLNDGKKLIFN